MWKARDGPALIRHRIGRYLPLVGHVIPTLVQRRWTPRRGSPPPAPPGVVVEIDRLFDHEGACAGGADSLDARRVSGQRTCPGKLIGISSMPG